MYFQNIDSKNPNVFWPLSRQQSIIHTLFNDDDSEAVTNIQKPICSILISPVFLILKVHFSRGNRLIVPLSDCPEERSFVMSIK